MLGHWQKGEHATATVICPHDGQWRSVWPRELLESVEVVSGRRRSTTSLGLRCPSPTLRRQRAWRTLVALRANIPMSQMALHWRKRGGRGDAAAASWCARSEAQRTIHPTTSHQLRPRWQRSHANLEPWPLHESNALRTPLELCIWRGGAHLRRLRCSVFRGGALGSENWPCGASLLRTRGKQRDYPLSTSTLRS